MARARSVTLKGTIERFSEAAALLANPGDYAQVVRGIPRAIVMRCPDGCGDLLTVNLDKRTGPAWRTYHKSGRLTIYPSVWRQDGCRSHFILWEDRLLWCDWREEANWNDPELLQAVLRVLPGPRDECLHYELIAAEIGAVPWDVLWACQRLVRSGQASAGGKGVAFRKRSASDIRGSDFLV